MEEESRSGTEIPRRRAGGSNGGSRHLHHESALFEPLLKGRLYAGIVDQITRSILLGKMRLGDQLPTEPELAEQFGVSRTVVREAIKALTLQGLVEVTPGRGSFISQPPAETVITSLVLMLKLEDHSLDDLMEARCLIEIPIAKAAAEGAQPENLEALARHLEIMREALHEGDLFVEHDTGFHGELARATQNPVLEVLVQPILMMMVAIRQAMTRVPNMTGRALSFHEQIYQAVVRRDGEAAERAMREHMAQVSEDIELARRRGLLDGREGVVSGDGFAP